MLEAWAAADPGTPDQGLTVKQEIEAIDEAMTRKDREFLARYGGFAKAGRRSVELQRRPEAKLTEGVSIDEGSIFLIRGFIADSFAVGLVMVDVAQCDEVIDRVRSPIFVMPFVMKLQHLARIVRR